MVLTFVQGRRSSGYLNRLNNECLDDVPSFKSKI